MLMLENIMLALSGLVSNKMRAFLTMLGIIIGIASVIAIMTVGDSITNSVTSSMESMGANNVTVGLKQKSQETETDSRGLTFEGGPRRAKVTDEDKITDEMLTKMTEEFSDDIKAVSLSESVGSGTAKDGKLYANVTITGINQGYLEANDLEVVEGSLFTQRDQEQGKKIAIVSDKLVDNMFDGDKNAAIGKTIDVMLDRGFSTYTIAGIYEYTASSYGFSSSSEEDVVTDLYIPLKTAQDQNHSGGGYEQITVVTQTGTDSETFLEELKSFFGVYYRNNENFEISAFSMESMISSMTEMLSTVSLAIAVIAGISLLVGGIGVMNIMLVSITERTREIGTRKALGATNQSIRFQFIVEAIVICMIGGAIGIVLGTALGSAAAKVMGYEASASVSAIAVSVGFSVAIGVFFGYYPANKAAKLNPIDALRYE